MDICWKTISSDFNRFCQKIRRLHSSNIQYIRTVEAHEDGYPHLHAIFQFPIVLRITNTRFFDRQLYLKWKSLWTRGHSDFKVPEHSRHPIIYIVKYISKDTPTHKTLWKKMLDASSVDKTLGSNQGQKATPTSAKLAPEPTFPITKRDLTLENCQKYKIKQLSWSRNFEFPNLTPIISK